MSSGVRKIEPMVTSSNSALRVPAVRMVKVWPLAKPAWGGRAVTATVPARSAVPPTTRLSLSPFGAMRTAKVESGPKATDPVTVSAPTWTGIGAESMWTIAPPARSTTAPPPRSIAGPEVEGPKAAPPGASAPSTETFPTIVPSPDSVPLAWTVSSDAPSAPFSAMRRLPALMETGPP